MQTNRLDATTLAAANKFHALLDDVKTVVFERDEIIDVLGATIVAKEHAFVLGLPGTAKSMMIDEIFARIAGARIASFQLTKGATPASLVGPMSIKALKEEDVFRFNTAGMLPDAEYAVIDEVFKGNAMTRNAALRILAEGEFDNGGQRVRAKLKSVFCTSNEVADALEDSAFYDRLLCRFAVDPVQDPDNRIAMITAGLSRRKGERRAKPMITVAELELLQSSRHDVSVPNDVHEAHLRLSRELETAGFHLGDRRLIGTMAVGQARALLAGRDTMTIDDLDIFRHTAWAHPDDRRQINSLVMRVVNPNLGEVIEIIDAIEDGFETMLQERAAAPSATSIEAMSASTRFLQQAQPQKERIEQIVDAMLREGRDATIPKQALYKIRRRLEQAISGTIDV